MAGMSMRGSAPLPKPAQSETITVRDGGNNMAFGESGNQGTVGAQNQWMAERNLLLALLREKS
eukprot:c10551_g1_i1 orf=2-187(-)